MRHKHFIAQYLKGQLQLNIFLYQYLYKCGNKAIETKKKTDKEIKLLLSTFFVQICCRR
jgi:hypothetical protein